MTSPTTTAIADDFAALASAFCSTVDRAETLDRTDFLIQTYRSLPKLIDAALSLPDVSPTRRRESRSGAMSNEEHQRRFNALQKKLADWDLHHVVFDPIKDTEAVPHVLSDD